MLRSKFFSPRIRIRVFALALLITGGALPYTGPKAAYGGLLEQWIAELEAATPTAGAGFEGVSLERLNRAGQNVEAAATTALSASQSGGAAAAMAASEQFLTAKQRVDAQLDAVLAMGSQVATFAVGLSDKQRERGTLRNYLRVCSSLIDASGRLRYMEYDVLRNTAVAVASQPSERQRLVDMLIGFKSDVGAIATTNLLIDPEGAQAAGLGSSLSGLQNRAMELIAASGETEVLPQLAAFAQRMPPSWITVMAADTIRRIGLPQDARPGQDRTLPPPAITAQQLRAALLRVSPASLGPAWAERHQELVAWLDERIAHGVPEDASLSLGGFSVRAGDWLLMRNPSPYNLFTDLSPGLFTHVGVVAWERAADGRGRLVLVDLPERGTSIPATNVETFIKRTRHFVFLRHQDPEVAKKMGAAAAAVIGNPSEFDLNFRTDRVLKLIGQPLRGKKIHTYCAGLLLLCALETDKPREDFFPISESSAGGLTGENMATLGMSLGQDFVSPSGALFSASMRIVGRKAPTYDPQREVEEAIYDHFAAKLATAKLQLSPDVFQSLRMKVAVASKTNKLLAQALAQAAGVSADMDLVSAARAAAVVETLDEVAYGASGQFKDAMAAIKGAEPDQAKSRRYQQIHADLFSLWEENQIHPRMLRIALTTYYARQGCAQIDRRFFQGPASAKR